MIIVKFLHVDNTENLYYLSCFTTILQQDNREIILQQGDYLKLPGNVILAWDLCCSSRWPSELKRKTLKARCSIPTITYQ